MRNDMLDVCKCRSYILLYSDGSCIYNKSFSVDPSDEDEILCVWGFEKELSFKEVLSNISTLVSLYRNYNCE